MGQPLICDGTKLAEVLQHNTILTSLHLESTEHQRRGGMEGKREGERKATQVRANVMETPVTRQKLHNFCLWCLILCRCSCGS